MKILQINTVYKNGGSTGRIVYDLANSIKQSGNEAYVAFGYEYVKTEDANTYMMESIPQLKISILQTRLSGEHGFYNKNATRRFLNYVDAVKPDILHLHNIHGHYINVELLFDYIKRNDIPVVWTLHDCWSFTGWCAYFDYAGCNKWQTGCQHCPNKHEYPFTWFFDRSKGNWKKKKETFTGVENLTIVTPSEWLAKLVKQSFLCNYSVEVINNGIDLNVFKPTESDFRKRYCIGDKRIVLAVANRMGKRKGIDYIIKLPDYLPENYQVVVVGAAEEDKSKFDRRIITIARTNNVKGLAEIYTAADVFINPTLEDNFPTTNLEALACGTPVVTFETGGSPESVGSCGRVVPKGDWHAFENAILEIVENDKIHLACIDRARQLYSKEAFANKYKDLYKELEL